MAVRRSITKVKQVLDISTDMGPLPEGRKPDTIWVLRKSDGLHIKINEKDYGEKTDKDGNKRDLRYPSRHFELAPEYDPEFDPRFQRAGHIAAVPPVFRESAYTADDLGQLSVKELRSLPEWQWVTVQRFSNHEAMVQAILDVREEHAPKPAKRGRRGRSRETLPESDSEESSDAPESVG